MSTPSYRAMQQARAERDSASAPAAMAAESAAAVMEAVPVVTAAAVSAGQSAQITAQALAQQTAIMTQSNNDLIDEMRRTREAVERLAPEIGLSFQKAVR